MLLSKYEYQSVLLFLIIFSHWRSSIRSVHTQAGAHGHVIALFGCVDDLRQKFKPT